MFLFAMKLLLEGVDVEFPADLEKVVGIMDQEIPWFTCDGYGYSLSSAKGTIGNRWEFLVKLANPVTRETLPSTVGRIVLERTDSKTVHLLVPPRSDEELSEPAEFDQKGRFFGSFVSQVINACQRHDLIQLPGALPTL